MIFGVLAPPLVLKHVFPIAKHPEEMLIPEAKDEVAVPSILILPVAVSPATVVVPRSAEPWTERSEDGDVVPMPMRPLSNI